MRVGGGVMREYALSVIMVSLLCAVVSALSPEGKMKKSVSFSLSLVLLCVLISPLFDALGDIKEIGRDFFQNTDISSGEDVINSDFEKKTERAVCDGLIIALGDKFGIGKDDVEAECKLRIIGSEVIFEKVEITLLGRAVFSDIHKIKEYIEDSLGCECEVYLLEA